MPGTTQLPSELQFSAFNRDENFAAAFLGVKIETLRTWRKRKTGPEFRKIGGKLVRYSVSSLQSFVEAQLS